MAKVEFAARSQAVFAECRDRVRADLSAMLAKHSATGMLRSGATAREAVRIYERVSLEGLTQLLDEIAKRIEHRGRAWNRATETVSLALAEHMNEAHASLEGALRVAGAVEGNAAARAVNDLLEEARDRLQQRIIDFRDGWTSPVPKPWKERHPYLDRLVFLAIGALITASLGSLASML